MKTQLTSQAMTKGKISVLLFLRIGKEIDCCNSIVKTRLQQIAYTRGRKFLIIALKRKKNFFFESLLSHSGLIIVFIN